jgi:hypothetical protein
MPLSAIKGITGIKAMSVIHGLVGNQAKSSNYSVILSSKSVAGLLMDDVDDRLQLRSPVFEARGSVQDPASPHSRCKRLWPLHVFMLTMHSVQ